MDEIIYSPLFLIILLVILVLVINAFLQIRWRVVPQEERLVIYRLGHFNRIAGPGPVMILQRFETVERTLRVLDQPASYTVQGLFMNGIPFGYTLNLWRSFDLKSAASHDPEALAKLAMFDDKTREQMIQPKLREALVQSAVEVQKQCNIPATAPLLQRLVTIVPGVPECKMLLEGTQKKLAETLPSIGVVLNQSQPITITQLHLGQDLLSGIEFNRTTEVLRQQYPKLSEEAMIQVLASIRGANPLNIASFSVADSQSQQIRPEVRMGNDGMSTRVKLVPQQAEEQPVAAAPVPDSQSGKTAAMNDDHLSKYDLSILKPVPRRPATGQQRTA